MRQTCAHIKTACLSVPFIALYTKPIDSIRPSSVVHMARRSYYNLSPVTLLPGFVTGCYMIVTTCVTTLVTD